MDIVAVLAELDRRQKEGGVFNRFFRTPAEREIYPHWMEFFKAGAKYKERLALCANQVGKTTSALAELTYHLTGLYPPWWEGKRFEHANDWWVAGVTQKDVRTVLQERLLGKIGEFGTGFIPKNVLDFSSIKDAKKAETPISTFRVRHVSGGYSTVEFKSYEQGRLSFQGQPGISILLDEEPPMPVYTEAAMRTINRNQHGEEGIIMLTFTPLLGISDMVLNYLDGADLTTAEGELSASRFVVRVGWDHTPHLTPEAKAALLATIPEHQRDARMKGIPSIGSGAIFPFSQDSYVIDPIPIPDHWPRAYGFDVGNNTAAVWGAYDRDSFTWYIYSEMFMVGGAPSAHASAIKLRGKWIKGAIDTSAHQRQQTDGQRLWNLYQQEDLQLTNAEKAVSSGLYAWYELLTQGRFKVFRDCRGLIEEMSMYRRDEKGNIVKKNDHRCFTAETEVWTSRGKVPIKELVGTTGKVVSLNGEYEDYQDCRLVDSNAEIVEVVFEDGIVHCTPDHKFLTTEGWVEASDLVGCSVINTPFKETSWTQSSSQQLGKTSTECASTSVGSTSRTTGQAAPSIFTEKSGNTTMAQSQKETKSIISTRTRRTTQSRILSALQNQSMEAGTNTTATSPKKRGMQQQSGTDQKQDTNSTFELAISVGQKDRSSDSRVFSAAESLKLTPLQVECVIKSVANGTLKVCQEVRRAGRREAVYCLTVPRTSAFVVTNGSVVHNCDATRYLIRTPGILQTELESKPKVYDYTPPRSYGKDAWMTR